MTTPTAAPAAKPHTSTRREAHTPRRAHARRAAHALALCTVPSGLWRLAMAAGLPVGYSDQVLRDVYGIPGWGIAYVVGLTVLQECAALLPLLLVSERIRLPRPRAVAVTARVVAGLVTLVFLSQLVLFLLVEPDPNMSPTGHLVAGLCYAPLLATGPLLAVVARAYGERHHA